MSVFSKDDVQATATAMTAMRAPHRGDAGRMPRVSQPVVDGGANPAAFQRRVALPFMTGDEQQDSLVCRNCALQRAVNGFPGSIQVVAMKINDLIGFDATAAQSPVPSAVERCGTKVFGPLWG